MREDRPLSRSRVQHPTDTKTHVRISARISLCNVNLEMEIPPVENTDRIIYKQTLLFPILASYYTLMRVFIARYISLVISCRLDLFNSDPW